MHHPLGTVHRLSSSRYHPGGLMGWPFLSGCIAIFLPSPKKEGLRWICGSYSNIQLVSPCSDGTRRYGAAAFPRSSSLLAKRQSIIDTAQTNFVDCGRRVRLLPRMLHMVVEDEKEHPKYAPVGYGLEMTGSSAYHRIFSSSWKRQNACLVVIGRNEMAAAAAAAAVSGSGLTLYATLTKRRQQSKHPFRDVHAYLTRSLSPSLSLYLASVDD